MTRPRNVRPATAWSLIAAIGCLGGGAWASDLVIPLEVPKPNYFGIGVGAYPDYLGSDDYNVGAAPFGRINLGGDRFAQVMANDVRVNLLDSPNWRLGPEFFWRFGREDVDNDAVRRVHEVDDSADVGLFGGYVWRDPQEVRKQAGVGGFALWDVSDSHDGWTAGVNAWGMYPVARPVTLAAGAGMTYGSTDYMDTYFGVTNVDSLRSGLPAYTAGSGVRDARGWVVAMLHLSPQWHLGAGVLYSRLLGDAADSPLVSDEGSKNQWVYGAGALYAW
jgi:outer membrane protein